MKISLRRNFDTIKLRNVTSGSLASFLIGTHCVYWDNNFISKEMPWAYTSILRWIEIKGGNISRNFFIRDKSAKWENESLGNIDKGDFFSDHKWCGSGSSNSPNKITKSILFLDINYCQMANMILNLTQNSQFWHYSTAFVCKILFFRPNIKQVRVQLRSG